MKKNKIIKIGITLLIIAGCNKKDKDKSVEIEPVADFTATVTGVSPNAKITLTNTTTDADSYEWEFGIGSQLSSSTEYTPSVLHIDRAGDYTIQLRARKGNTVVTTTKTLTINGYTAIATMTDLSFARVGTSTTYGRYFVADDSKVYLASELTTDLRRKVNFVFATLGNTGFYFDDPSVTSYNLTGATKTKVANYSSPALLTTAQYDAMTTDSILSTFSIVHDNESFGSTAIPHIVLFELFDGRKGAIKTKSVNADRLLVDIKIEKYK